MKKAIIKRLATIAIGITCLTICALGVRWGVNSFFNTSAQAVEQSSGFDDSAVKAFLKDSYYVGKEVSLPDILENGAQAERILYDPAGNGYVKDSIVFSQSGEWKLMYQCNAVTKEYSFVVYPSVASINGVKSKVNVGKASDYLTHDAQGRSGIVAQVAYNESITFNEVIDLNGKTKNDTFFEFSAIPEVYGLEDASIFVITLTDAEDADNKIEIHLRAEPFETDPWMQRVIYVRTGATGQAGVGLYEYADGSLTYDDKNYVVFEGGYSAMFGTHLIFSLRSVGVGSSEKNIGHQVLGLSMDYEQKRLYAYTRNNGDAVGPHIISDYDDPSIYGDVLWEGFKSGRCRVTVSAKQYLASTFSLLVTKLGDKTTFENPYIENTTPAEIFIQDAEMDTIPYLVKDKPFTVPQAIAYDIFGNKLSVATNVYTGYGTGAQANVKLVNSKFTPTQYREYTLVYTCKDQWGNLSEQIYQFNVLPEAEIEKFAVTVGIATQNSVLGKTNTLKIPNISNSYIGYYNIDVVAQLGNETVYIGSYNNTSATNMYTFRPEKAGDWLICYKYSDMYINDVAYYTLSVATGGESYFETEAAVPHYAVLNGKLEIPTLYGYNCTGSQIVLEKAEVYITTGKDITGAMPYSGSSIIWTEKTDFIYLTYCLGNAQKQYEIPVVDVGYKTADAKAEKYFYGYKGTPIYTDSSINYMVDVNNNRQYKLGFVNKVLMYSWKFDLVIPKDADYSGVSVYLYDAYDAGNVLKMKYNIAEDGKVYYSLNDAEPKYYSDLEKGALFKFSYDAILKQAFFMTVNQTVYTNLAQNAWNGFTDNMAWMEIVLEDVSGDNTNIEIRCLNNQTFYNADSFDLLDMSPEFYQDLRDISAKNQLNSVIDVPLMYAWDVLALDMEAMLTVTAPDGSIVTSLDGTLLNKVRVNDIIYQVQLSQYGEYSFNYTIMDDLGRINKRGSFQVSAVDTEPPTVEIGSYAEVLSINSKLEIATIAIVDNMGGEYCTYSVYVHTPNYETICLSTFEGDIILNQKGEYTVWYYISDSTGNVSMISYEIYVQ